MNVNFGSGKDTVLMNMENNQLFSYEVDSKLLHSLYGGKQYYTSCSGMSGAGFLDFSLRENNLIELGSYRSDKNTRDHLYYREFEDNIKIFIPVKTHAGIDVEYPIVISDGNKVGFYNHYDTIFESLEKFKEGGDSFKTIITTFFKIDGSEHSLRWKFSNQNKKRGVNALAFIDTPEEELGEIQNFMGEKLHLHKINDEEYLHRNQLGFFDQKLLVEDIESLDNEIVEGWRYAGFYYRRINDRVSMFKETTISGKYYIEGSDYESFEEYELEVGVLEFYQHSKEHWNDELEILLLEKIRKNWIWEKRKEMKSYLNKNLKKVLEENPNLIVKIEDSIKTGNCSVGTEAFRKKYSLKEEMTFGELLEAKNFDEFRLNRNFVKVIGSVIVDNGITIQ